MTLEVFKLQKNKSYKLYYFQLDTLKYSINGSNQEQDYFSTALQELVKLY